MPSAKILMLVGDYVEDYEVMVPFQTLHVSATPSTPFAPTKNPAKPCAQPFTISKAIKHTPKSLVTISR